MPHRHWGVRATKPPVPLGPPPAAAWSGGAFVGIIVVIMIVLGVALYAVSNTVTDVANTAASAPPTTGQGAGAPTPSGGGAVE
jgi:hypothetical protein